MSWLTSFSAKFSSAAGAAPRWLRWLLIGSLAVNLLGLGAVTGTLWHFRHGAPWGASFGAQMIGFAAQLPTDRRQQLWQETAELRRSLRPQWREVGRIRRELAEMLRADTVDADRFAAAYARLNEAETRARVASQPLIGELARRLTKDERRQMLSMRERHRSGRRGPLSEPGNALDDAAPLGPPASQAEPAEPPRR